MKSQNDTMWMKESKRIFLGGGEEGELGNGFFVVFGVGCLRVGRTEEGVKFERWRGDTILAGEYLPLRWRLNEWVTTVSAFLSLLIGLK